MHNPNGISALEFRQLTDLIRSECGIVFTESRRNMIEGRLGKRTRALGLGSLSAYCKHLHTAAGRRQEIRYLIDEVTTHKTDFFREPAHFDYLVNQICPELAESTGAGIRQPLRVWSAASSTSEEPYTLAMVLSDFAAQDAWRGYRSRIDATDISEGVVEKAQQAVYPVSLIGPVPERMRKAYMLRSKDRAHIRFSPAIRAMVGFRPLNLMDSDYQFTEPLDVVFCRNVMIYFDRPTQRQILLKILATLQPQGYLLMGHSESLNGLNLPVEQVAPTVYRRLDA
jgi:chemotaxis protein methyltransferase CheR